MGSLHDPAPGFVSRLALPGLAFFFALFDVGPVLSRRDGFSGRFALVSGIGASMPGFTFARLGAFAHDAVQRGRQQFHVMLVGSADDEG